MAAWAQRADITLADNRQRRAVTVQTTAKSLTAMGIATLDGCLAVQAHRADISVANAAPQTPRPRRGNAFGPKLVHGADTNRILLHSSYSYSAKRYSYSYSMAVWLLGCLAVQAQRADISVANAAPQTLRLRRGETIRSIKIPAINSIARCAIKIPRFVK